jgi:hypothetical protein
MRFLGLLAAAFGLGLYCFFRGFRFMRRYQVLADTPQSPIRGAAMGFVEVSGTARGDETVASPVTHTPCYFYKVKIDRWDEGGRGGGRWVAFASDGDGVRFYLEDQTGRILVDAQDAEIDLQDPCETEVTREFFPSFEGDAPATAPAFMPPTRDALMEYINLVSSGRVRRRFKAPTPRCNTGSIRRAASLTRIAWAAP